MNLVIESMNLVNKSMNLVNESISSVNKSINLVLNVGMLKLFVMTSVDHKFGRWRCDLIAFVNRLHTTSAKSFAN